MEPNLPVVQAGTLADMTAFTLFLSVRLARGDRERDRDLPGRAGRAGIAAANASLRHAKSVFALPWGLSARRCCS